MAFMIVLQIELRDQKIAGPTFLWPLLGWEEGPSWAIRTFRQCGAS
jgi:hypothetical protein